MKQTLVLFNVEPKKTPIKLEPPAPACPSCCPVFFHKLVDANLYDVNKILIRKNYFGCKSEYFKGATLLAERNTSYVFHIHPDDPNHFVIQIGSELLMDWNLERLFNKVLEKQ